MQDEEYSKPPGFDEFSASLRAINPAFTDEQIAGAFTIRDRRENPRLYQPDFETYKKNMAPTGWDEDTLRATYEKAYPFSTWEVAKTQLASGAYGLLHGAAGLMDMAGLNDWAADLNDYATKGLRANAPRPGLLEDYVEHPERLADPRAWVGGAANMLPSVAASMVPGGLAFRAAGGMAAVRAGSRLPQLAAMGAGGAAGGAMEAGPAYYSALERGMSQEEARAHALKFGGAVSVLNALPVGAAFSKLGRFGLPGRAVATGIGEAVTEVAEGPAEALLLGDDLWEALKSEADVAPGALLAGMLFGAVGSPGPVQRPAGAVPVIPEGATARPRAPVTEITGGFVQGAGLETLNAVPQQTRMETRAMEAGEAGRLLQTDEVFARQEAEQRAMIAQEEEVAWQRHRAQTEMPAVVKDQLIRAEVERAYQGRAPSQMEQAFRASLPAGLPPATVEAAVRTAMASGELPGLQGAIDMRPVNPPTPPGEAPSAERLAELQLMADTGRVPATRPTLHEERLLNRAHLAMASGVTPPGTSVRRVGNGFELTKDGKLVGTYPTALAAHTTAQAIATPAAVQVVEEAALPFSSAPNPARPGAFLARTMPLERPALKTRTELAPREVYAEVPVSAHDIQVGWLKKFGSESVLALNYRVLDMGGEVRQLTIDQARAMSSLLGTLENLGVPRGTMDLVDGLMAVRSKGGGVHGVHLRLNNGQRVIAVSHNLLDAVATGDISEGGYMSAVYTLAHELGHLVGNGYAVRSKFFQDQVMDEMARAWISGPQLLQSEFHYPFRYLGERNEAEVNGETRAVESLDRMLAVESFAQLFASYYVYRPNAAEEIGASIPSGWALMREVDRAINTAAGNGRGRGLQAAFRIERAAVDGAQYELGPIASADYSRVGDGRADRGGAATAAAGAIDRGGQLLAPRSVAPFDTRFTGTTVVPATQLNGFEGAHAPERATRFLSETLAGGRPMRRPPSVRQEADGTYTVIDGRSAVTAAISMGFGEVPVRVIDQVVDADGQTYRLADPAAQARLEVQYQDAGRWKDKLDKRVEKIAAAFNGYPLTTVLKGRRKTVGKVNNDYEGDPGRMKDILRATVVMNSAGDAAAVRAMIESEFNVVGDTRDLFTAAGWANGYQDMKFSVEHEGRVYEVQANTAEMIIAKELFGHTLYDMQEKAEDLAFKQALVKAQAAIYGYAKRAHRDGVPLAEFLPRLREVSVREAETLNRQYGLSIRFENRSIETSAPFLTALASEYGPGGFRSNRKPQGAGSESDTATGIPSTSRNLESGGSAAMAGASSSDNFIGSPPTQSISLEADYDQTMSPARHFNEADYRVVKGTRSGMPDQIQTAEDVARLVSDWVLQLEAADASMLNHDDWTWYERVGEHVRMITHGDRDEMERMIRILALLSSDDTVQNNTNAWVRSAYELMAWQRAGRDVAEFRPEVGRYPNAMANYIQAAMQAEEFNAAGFGVGHKVMNFYRNLHDAATGENRWPEASTIDRWMLWAFGFPTTIKSAGSASKVNPLEPPGKYRFGMAVVADITDEYNRRHGTAWLPRNIQAAIWTLKMNQSMAEKGRAPVHEDYVKTLRQATQTVTAEAIPSTKSALDGFIAALPFEQREAFTSGAWQLLQGPNGENLLAQKLKLPFHNTERQVGGYAGDVNPNILFSPVALKTNGTWDKTLVRIYARALQTIFQQEAVPWVRMDETLAVDAAYALKKGKSGPTMSVRYRMTGGLSNGAATDLMRRMADEGLDPGFTRITGSEVLISNFAGDPEFPAKVDSLAAKLKADGKLQDSMIVGVESEYGHEQDWSADPTGEGAGHELALAAAEGYNLSATERSDLLDWVRDRAGAFAEYARDFKQKARDPVTIDEVSYDQAGGSWTGTKPPDPRYVGSINLTHLRTQEDIEGFLRDGWRQYAEMINQRRREVRDWGTTEAAARTLGMTIEDFLQTPLGQAGNAETLEWSRMVLESQGQVLKRAVRAFSDAPTETNKISLERERQKLLAIQAIHSGLATEAGRALNILAKKTQDVKDMVQFAKDLDNRDLKLEDYAAMIEQLEDTGQITAVTRATSAPKLTDKILEIWINFLLSGPQTQATNVLSNTVVSLFSNVEMLIAAGIGKLTGSQAVTFRQASAYASGTLSGAVTGLKAAQKAFVTEEGSGEYKIDVRRYQAIEGPGGRLVRVPGRLLLAGDELFKGVARGQMRRMVAMREAEEHVRQHGGDIGAKFEQLMAHPNAGMEREVNEWADMQTYTNRLGEFGQAVQKMAAAHPLMRVVFPFIRTPVNIVKFAAKRSPLAFLMKADREALLGHSGQRARDMAWSRVVVGSGIGGLLAQFVAQGLITGGGPDDPKKRGAMYADGWQPYSLLIGDTYHSYARMEPLGILLGATADAVEISEAWGEIEAEDVAGLLVASISNNLTSKTFLRGLSELVNVLTDPTRYGERYIQNLSGTVVPTLFSQIARTEDPNLRDVRSITDKIKSRIPGESYSLPYRYDILGNAIKLEGSAGPDLLSPIYVSKVQGHPVIAAMKDADYYPGMPGRKVNGVELPPAVYADYARLANSTAARTLEQLVQTAWWRSLPQSERADKIRDAYTRARKQARAYILSRPENRGLVTEMIALKRQEAVGF